MAKILIVDDEPSIRFLINSTLEDEGYEIIEASDGLEAKNLLKAERPDLVLLDVMMPVMTGYELCKLIKEDPASRNIIVVMLTAKGQERDRIDSKAAGADFYLRKPFSPFELIEIIDRLLKQSSKI